MAVAVLDSDLLTPDQMGQSCASKIRKADKEEERDRGNRLMYVVGQWEDDIVCIPVRGCGPCWVRLSEHPSGDADGQDAAMQVSHAGLCT